MVGWFGRWPGSRNRIVQALAWPGCKRRIQRVAFASIFAVTTDIAQSFLLVTRILNGETRKGIGNNVAMMQPLHLRISSEVKPQSVHKLYVIGLQRRSMGSDVKALRIAIRHDDIEGKLPFWLRQVLPCLTHMIGLLLRGHLCR